MNQLKVARNKPHTYLVGRSAEAVLKGVSEIKRDRALLIMLLPGLLYYVVFKFIPMVGMIMAFQDYNITKGFFESPWVGFSNFQKFFSSPDAWRLIRNTFLISFYNLIFGFPAPILLALAFNEIGNKYFNRIAQSITFLPHFISSVVIIGLVVTFLAPSSGLVNILLNKLGMDSINFLMDPRYFRAVYTAQNIWKDIGWGAILYLAALTAINPELYEAAVMDGASKFKQTIHITIPGIMPTIVIRLILELGNTLDVGAQTILLLYNPMVYETADVLSTYVYRRGLLGADYSYAAAVDVFTALVGLVLVIISNNLSRRVTGSSMW